MHGCDDLCFYPQLLTLFNCQCTHINGNSDMLGHSFVKPQERLKSTIISKAWRKGNLYERTEPSASRSSWIASLCAMTSSPDVSFAEDLVANAKQKRVKKKNTWKSEGEIEMCQVAKYMFITFIFSSTLMPQYHHCIAAPLKSYLWFTPDISPLVRMIGYCLDLKYIDLSLSGWFQFNPG